MTVLTQVGLHSGANVRPRARAVFGVVTCSELQGHLIPLVRLFALIVVVRGLLIIGLHRVGEIAHQLRGIAGARSRAEGYSSHVQA